LSLAAGAPGRRPARWASAASAAHPRARNRANSHFRRTGGSEGRSAPPTAAGRPVPVPQVLRGNVSNWRFSIA
jgi:hypothetical protein